MRPEYIKIQETNEEGYTIQANLSNGNIWLTEYEIADLFGVFVSTVSSKLKRLFREKLLDEQQVKRNTEIIKRRSKTKYKTYVEQYNMEAITMLSYHLKSKKAQFFRKWILKVLSDNIQEENQADLIHSMWFYDKSQVN